TESVRPVFAGVPDRAHYVRVASAPLPCARPPANARGVRSRGKGSAMQHEASLPATSPVNGVAEDENVDLRQLLRALQDVSDGDFSARLPGDWTGLSGKIADTFNEIVNSNRRMADELERIGEVVGKRGKTRQRVSCGRRIGAWGDMEDSVNTMIDDLLWPTAEVTRAITAVAKG